MREIVIDTETTGLDPNEGHRIVEVACVELFNHLPTGNSRRFYVNPERDMPADALAVHGLTTEFLAGHPPFAPIADELLAFLGGDRLIIHNAGFDVAFLNAELARLGRPGLAAEIEDTMALARKRFPGAPASLDALCRRFGIDLSDRGKHSAKLDCELLAQVYLELVGGRQPGLDLAVVVLGGTTAAGGIARPFRPPRPHLPEAAEIAAHERLLDKLQDPLWRR